MAMSNEALVNVLKAQIDTTNPAGLSGAQDAEAFVDLAIDQTDVLKAIRTETNIRTTFHLDNLALGEPVVVGATEGAAPAAEDVIAITRTRKTLAPKEVIAAFDVSFSFLRKNIEQNRANERLNRIFARRFGKDILMMAFMGDTATVGSTRADKALKVLDGFVTQARADSSVHALGFTQGAVFHDDVFPVMLSMLPKDYRDQREELGFFVPASIYDQYAVELGRRNTAMGDMLLAGPWKDNLSYLGVKLYPVYGLSENNVLLTLRENLAVGFGHELTVGRDLLHRERVMKVTLTAEVDARYVVGDAIVLGVKS